MPWDPGYVPGRSQSDLYVKDFDSGEVFLASSDSDNNQLLEFGNYGSSAILSGDGDKVLFTSRGSNGSAQLYLKSLSSEN